MPAARSIVGALCIIGGIALFGLSVFYLTLESDEFGRLPFLIIGGIGAATGLALSGAGILLTHGTRNVGSLALFAIAFVGLGLVLFFSGLGLFVLVPVAVVLLVVAQRLLSSDVRRRTA